LIIGASSIAQANVRALIVEDDGLQRKVLVRRLQSLGVTEVYEASDGERAMEILAERSDIDLIVSDLDMPRMDGLELLCQVAKKAYKASFVLHSAMNRQLLACMELMATERQLNFLGILSKPASSADIAAIIGRLCVHRERPPKVWPTISVEERRDGLRSGQFAPHFQPKVRFRDRTVVGAEALARWHHPVHGALPPLLFIDAFEQEGLMGDLTHAILDQSIEAASRWGAAGAPISVSVNMSVSYLSQPGIADQISALTRRHGVPPERVCIEITESVSMSDVGGCLENIARLKMRGHTLSIDDFGVGFSSLQQLVRIPFDEIKLDRSFVTGVVPKSRAALMLEATLVMARKLEMVSVAEGIETEEEWAFLEGLGCDMAQGYLISKPLAPEAFLDWVTESPPTGTRIRSAKRVLP
jgi:EAL domain-containing protein (putative c-di-GMP-specific phosphodiesterase class I)/ActR/RegA family two-component response regulator